MPDISKKQLKNRKIWFAKWKPDINNKLSSWFETMSEEERSKFNFSQESLNHIESKMLDRFSSANAFADLSNNSIIDLFGTYIGETFKRNHCIELTWTCNFVGAGIKDWVNFYPFLTSSYTNCYSILNMKYILHQRTGDKLINHFLNKEKLFLKAKKENNLKEKTPSMEIKGFEYQHFILCSNINFNVVDLEKELNSFQINSNNNYTLSKSDSHLILTTKDNYSFHFSIDKSPEVKIESQEIADSYEGSIKNNTIADCATRIEFWGDTDNSGNYMNESLFILEHFERNKDFLIYDVKSGNFLT